jgi:DUF1365 family protein
VSAWTSGLYIGRVRHARQRPRRHALAYGVFMLLIDLDETVELARRLRWFSVNRFNLVSFHPQDHGDGSITPLRTQIEGHLDRAELSIAGGKISLLCLPRVLGYVFNPLSLYFCYRPDGGLHVIVYEVSSTFGERHSYVIPAGDGQLPIRQNAAKRLHVSPFMDMALTYAFKIDPPSEHVRVAIDVIDAEGLLLAAGFVGRRREFTDHNLLAAWVRHPLLTLKVIAAIHWEALKIFSKGIRLRAGPRTPKGSASLGADGPPQMY